MSLIVSKETLCQACWTRLHAARYEQECCLTSGFRVWLVLSFF